MMTTTTIPEMIAWPKMPLSVYREVAAHLCQVAGVEVDLLPQTSQQFDYTLSQVGGLRINGDNIAAAEDKARVVEILNYYGDRFGDWQLL